MDGCWFRWVGTEGATSPTSSTASRCRPGRTGRGAGAGGATAAQPQWCIAISSRPTFCVRSPFPTWRGRQRLPHFARQNSRFRRDFRQSYS